MRSSDIQYFTLPPDVHIVAVGVFLPELVPVPEQPHLRRYDAVAAALGDAVTHHIDSICVVPLVDEMPADSFFRSRGGGRSQCIIPVDPVSHVVSDERRRQLVW